MLIIFTLNQTNYIIMWSYPGSMPKYYPGLRDILPDRIQNITQVWETYYPTECKILPRSEWHISFTRPKGRVICLSDLGNILAYYLDKTTLISLLYWVSNCPGIYAKIFQYQISLQKLTRSIIIHYITYLIKFDL